LNQLLNEAKDRAKESHVRIKEDISEINRLLDLAKDNRHWKRLDAEERDAGMMQIQNEIETLMDHIPDDIEKLWIKREKANLMAMKQADELDRLEHMGELMVFSEIPTSDYLEDAHPEDWKMKSKLEHYHPNGSMEYLMDKAA